MSGTNVFAQTIANDVNVVPVDTYENRLSKGLIAGASVYHGAGRGVINGTESTVRGGAVPATYVYLSSPVAMEIISTSVNDTAAGSGARTVIVTGIDASGNVKTETVSMNGTTAVALSGTWLRMYGAECITQGTSAQVGVSNAGVITVRTAGAGAVHATMPIAKGAALTASFPVPLGKVGHLHHVNVSQDGNKSLDIRIYRRNGMLLSAAPFSSLILIQEYLGRTTALDRHFYTPIVFNDLTDFFITVAYSGGGGTADVSVDFTIEILDA